MTSPLFTSFQVGSLTLPNRMVMAPMTRGRANSDGSPNELIAQYYKQRATAGLIVTEATAISPQGTGWVGAPGIFTDAHVAGWKLVTDAVHQAGGHIFLQLWHMGRVSHPDFLNGELPVGPSAVAAIGETHTPFGKKSYVTPRALTLDEIKATIADYGRAAKLAKQAGFDGVEMHAANGYLIDQFIRDCSNKRTDEYGGSIENRVRFLMEATKAAIAEWSADRVAVRFSPTSQYNDMSDSTAEATFTYASERLGELGLAYLHIIEPIAGQMFVAVPPVAPSMRRAFKGTVIVNGGYDAITAAAAINEGLADAVAFGVPFLTTPDLVHRFDAGLPLNAPDYSTIHTNGANGFTDYPVLS